MDIFDEELRKSNGLSLIMAVEDRSVERCRRMLACQGACDVNAVDDRGRTALMRAVRLSYPEIVDLLAPHCDMAVQTQTREVSRL